MAFDFPKKNIFDVLGKYVVLHGLLILFDKIFVFSNMLYGVVVFLRKRFKQTTTTCLSMYKL